MKKKIFVFFSDLKKGHLRQKRMLLANTPIENNGIHPSDHEKEKGKSANKPDHVDIRSKPDVLEPLNIDSIINNAIARAASNANNTGTLRKLDPHTTMINRKLTMARKENPHSIKCVGMPPTYDNFIFTYSGLRIQPDGTISPITFEDGHVLQTILNLPLNVRRTSLGYRPKYREIMFHGFYEHKFFLYFQHFTEEDHYRFEHLEPHEKRALSFPRNRYSDLFDMLIYGDILIVDENRILQPTDLAECWKQRRF